MVPPPPDGGSLQIQFIDVNGRSLLDEVELSKTDYTVVAPNTYKLLKDLDYIKNFAQQAQETTCQTAVQNKINNIPDSNKFCSIPGGNIGLPACNISNGKTKVVEATCAYGSGVPDDYIKCKTLDRQF